MQPSNKRSGEYDKKFEPDAKRVRTNEWQREKIESRCVVDLSRPVIFIDMTFEQYNKPYRFRPRGKKPYHIGKTPKFHANGEPMSVCYQYVLWLNPDIQPDDRAVVHSHYSEIESWSNVFGQHFFRNEPFNFLGLPYDFQREIMGYWTPKEMSEAQPAHALFRAHQPQPCETVTFDLSDPELRLYMAKWKIECDTDRLKIKKVIVEGPLALQESPTQDEDMWSYEGARRRRFELIDLLKLADVITFKSLEATDLGNAYMFMREGSRPKSIHVEELRVGANTHNVAGDTQFLKIARMFERGVLSADRWVYGLRGKSIETLQNTLGVQNLIFPVDRPIYIAVDQTNDEALFEIEGLGIRNYIVPTQFRDMPNEAVRALLNSAENVIYRPFYADLMDS